MDGHCPVASEYALHSNAAARVVVRRVRGAGLAPIGSMGQYFAEGRVRAEMGVQLGIAHPTW